jgi:hypothetical protein
MIIWLVIAFVAGAFVGWNVPQPEFAKKLQARVKARFDR